MFASVAVLERKFSWHHHRVMTVIKFLLMCTFCIVIILRLSAHMFSRDAPKSEDSSTHDSLCPSTPPGLVGPIPVLFDVPALSEIEKLYPNMNDGGHGEPSTCRARHKVAVIVPFRDRKEHLPAFLHHMHSFLAKQQLNYTIFVVEQATGDTFNRGKLLNVGFVEALKSGDYACFIFHDVDLFPEDDRILYTCGDQPRHLSVAIDKFNYQLLYETIFGGAVAITRQQFELINGYSGAYWGWGGEDDDLYSRVILAGYNISRLPIEIARYKMIKHELDPGNSVNKCRHYLLALTHRMWRIDGLWNLDYKRISLTHNHLYTNVTVDLHEEKSRGWMRSQRLFPSQC